MGRKTRKTAILAKLEATYGTDAVPTGVANAIQVSNPTYELISENVARELMRPFMGASEDLTGTRWAKVTFDVEISGSGTAGTAPAWGPLLRACAMAEVLSAGVSVEYSPVTDALESLSIYHSIAGVRNKLLGCMGNAQLMMEEGTRAVFKFTFIGLDGGAFVAGDPTLTLTAWKVPLAITNANTAGIKLGASYAAGVLTGGTGYPSRGITLDLGNAVKQVALLGDQSVDVNDRASSGSCQLSLTDAQEVAMRADINSNTLTSLGFVHGLAAGAKVLVFAPKVQRTNPKYQDYEGRVLMGMDLRLTPDVGNDELRIVAL